MLRYCAETLCRPLHKLFTLSLEASDSSYRWSKLNACYYRGISKLSAIPKLFGNIITPLFQHSCRSLISYCQHGFIKRRSTTTNLLEFTSFVTRGFRKNCQTDVIYTDFSKAFDSVNHQIIIRKLDLLGFPGGLLRWILSYLNNRTQREIFKNEFTCTYVRR